MSTATMQTFMQSEAKSLVRGFMKRFAATKPIFYKELERSRTRYPELFHELSEILLPWAALQLGPDFADVLINGYCSFTIDVNRCQLAYEKARQYAHKTYADVYENAYNSPDFMNLYHWGVFTTTFAWAHHLRIYRMFRDSFLQRLALEPQGGSLLDLGAGSGLWNLLASRQLPQWRVTAVDISETSVRIARETHAKACPESPSHWVCADATSYRGPKLAQAGISCFLLEHLEAPAQLLTSLAENLVPGAYAFVTLALTAAELDHIFEFQRESEPIQMAENAGFRVLETLSSAPDSVSTKSHYLPRSMAMLLQKRHNPIW